MTRMKLQRILGVAMLILQFIIIAVLHDLTLPFVLIPFSIYAIVTDNDILCPTKEELRRRDMEYAEKQRQDRSRTGQRSA